MKSRVLCLSFLTGLIFMGCGHTTELISENLPETEPKVNYSVTYYIHADSDYLYHTPDGKAVQGNSKVLETAFKVGEAAKSGEVFIYYQRPEKNFLGLFPRKSSRFFHYKNSQLINKVKFRHPDKKEAFLTTEAQLLNKYGAHNLADDHKNYFLYFGHEIPSENDKSYHRTLPGINVNTHSFVKGIQNFLLYDEERFDLVVLSTCNNGTPAMAKLLMPFTDAMLTSPQNLHLSHIDSDTMKHLESESNPTSIQLARSMAEQTFQRLDTTVQTSITLALYDFEKVQAYIHALSSLTSANNAPDKPAQVQDNVDCAELFFLDFAYYRNGVETWYKPARFGRQSGQSTHSGWGCKPAGGSK